MSTNINRRLADLESMLPDASEQAAIHEQEEADRQRELALWQELFETMSADHVELVLQEATAQYLALEAGRTPALLSALTQQAFNQVHTHFYQRQYQRLRRLALPPAIAAAYLEHPDASPLHDCEQCGTAVPILTGRAQPYRPVRRLFDTCPACGGRVGYAAFHHSMYGTIRRCSVCHELQAVTPEQTAHLGRSGRPSCTCVGFNGNTGNLTITEATECPESVETHTT